MRKVIHIAANYPPRLGGLEKVAEELAIHQKKLGMDVEVITSKLGYDPQYKDRVKVTRLSAVEIANTPLMPTLLFHLLQIKKSSIAHIHVAQAFVPEMVLMASKIKRFPYIAHMHLDIAPSGKAGILLKIYKPLILKRVLRNAMHVIVFSHEQKEVMIQKYGLAPEQVQVVPNGVDESFFNTTPRALSSKPKLLFVGRLSVQKNLKQLLAALEGVSDKFETYIAGDGELKASLEQQSNKLALQNVRFLGRKNGQELKDLYIQSDIFVLPSEREGMPLVLLEAMAMALPIVGTNVTGIRDLVAQGENGLLVPFGDVRALREALVKIISNNESYVKMSQKSYNLGLNYSWDKVAQTMQGYYE